MSDLFDNSVNEYDLLKAANRHTDNYRSVRPNNCLKHKY